MDLAQPHIEVSDEWQTVFDLFRRGDLKLAVTRLERIRFLTSDDRERRRALLYLVRSNIALNNPRMAMLYALEGAKILDDSLSNFMLSLASAASGDPENAVRHLRKNIESSPFEAIWHFQLGKLLSERLHRHEEALSEFRWATKLEGSKLRFWLPVVETLLRLGRLEEAKRCCRQLERRRWVRRYMVEAGEGEEETEEVVTDDFAAHHIQLLLAKVLRVCGDAEEAEAVLERLHADDIDVDLDDA